MEEQPQNIDFDYNGQQYSVPVDHVSEFMKRMPDAKVTSSGNFDFSFNNQSYSVPSQKVSEFVVKMPDAKMVSFNPEKTEAPINTLGDYDKSSISKVLDHIPSSQWKNQDWIYSFVNAYSKQRKVDPSSVRDFLQKRVWEDSLLELEDKFRKSKDQSLMPYIADLNKKLGNDKGASEAENLMLPAVGNGDYHQDQYTPTRLGFSGKQGFTTPASKSAPTEYDTQPTAASKYMTDIANQLETHAPGVAQMHMISSGIDKMKESGQSMQQGGDKIKIAKDVLHGAVGAAETVMGAILSGTATGANGFLPFDFLQNNLPPKVAEWMMPASKLIKDHYDGNPPTWAQDIGFVGDIALLGILHKSYNKIKETSDWKGAPDKYFENLKKDPEAMKQIFADAEAKAKRYEADPQGYVGQIRRNGSEIVDGLKENADKAGTIERAAEPYKPVTPPDKLQDVELGSHVKYKGESGVLDREDDGTWTFTRDGDEKVMELPVSDKVNPKESLSDIGLEVVPVDSPSNIAKALSDKERVGQVDYKGKKYVVSVGNRMNPEDTTGDIVYEVAKDGKLINRFDSHPDQKFAQDRKLAIINAFMDQEGVMRRSQLYEPWRKEQESPIQNNDESKLQNTQEASQEGRQGTQESIEVPGQEVQGQGQRQDVASEPGAEQPPASQGLAKRNNAPAESELDDQMVDYDTEVVQREMKPYTDGMAKVEIEFSNKGFDIDWDHDNEIIVTNKKTGDIVDPEDLPEDLHEAAAKYEEYTQKLGDYDYGSFRKALNRSREDIHGKEVDYTEVNDGAPPYETYSRQDFIDEFGEDAVGAYDDKLREDLANGTIEKGVKEGWLVPEGIEMALDEAGIEKPEWLTEEPEFDAVAYAKKHRIRLRGVGGKETLNSAGNPIEWEEVVDIRKAIKQLEKIRDAYPNEWRGSRFESDYNLYKNELLNRQDEIDAIQSVIDNATYVPRRKNGVIVRLPIDMVLENQEPSFKVERGNENEIGNRIDKAKEHLEKKPSELEASDIYIKDSGANKGKIGFGDGRHRLIAAKELGATHAFFELDGSPEQQKLLQDIQQKWNEKNPQDANEKQGPTQEAMGDKSATGAEVRGRNAEGQKTAGEGKPEKEVKPKKEKPVAEPTKADLISDIKRYNRIPKRRKTKDGSELRSKIMRDAKKLNADIRIESDAMLGAYSKEGIKMKASGVRRTPEEIQADKQQKEAIKNMLAKPAVDLRTYILKKILQGKMVLNADDIKRFTGFDPKEFPSMTVGKNGVKLHDLWESMRGDPEVNHLAPESDHDFADQVAGVLTEYSSRDQMWQDLKAKLSGDNWAEMGFRSQGEYEAWLDHMKESEEQGISLADVSAEDIGHAHSIVDQLSDEEVDKWLSDLDEARPKTEQEINQFYEQHGIETTTEEPTTEEPAADEQPGETGGEAGNNASKQAQPSPEEQNRQVRLEEAEKRISTARDALNAKRAELDRAIVDDQQDLFGERKSDEKAGMFDERVDPGQRSKILAPYEKALRDAVLERDRIVNEKVQGTGTLGDDMEIHLNSFDMGLRKLMEEDVLPRLKVIGQRAVITGKGILDTISPLTRSSRYVKDVLFTMKGDRAKEAVMLHGLVESAEKAFDRMPDAERIAFIDRMKTGKPQPTPELQATADLLRSLDDNLYAELQKYNPSIAWKEDHFRVLWKKIPGAPDDLKGFFGFGKRPLKGSKGMFKMATLKDMSEGIAKGGEPVTTNPVTMFKLAYDDAMKFITAQKMWDELRSTKHIRFVESNSRIPDGFIPVDYMIDESARKRYLKVQQPTGTNQTSITGAITPVMQEVNLKGQWYIDEGAGRMLNNFLSRDRLREDTPIGSVGKSLLELKNAYTVVELSLSPFHAVAEGIEAMSSQAGLGFRKLINTGAMKGDISEMFSGIKDILTSPIAPGTAFSLGKNAVKYLTKAEFMNTPEARSWIAKNPNANYFFDLLFKGGGKLEVNEDYKLATLKSLKENYGKDNYIGAALRTIPAVNESLLSPLFNVYIPNLKVGLFMREIGQALKENEGRLAKGLTTEEEIARKTWAFVEDRIGEMNFDNLFWDRTFKTGMQLMFRSVTWKLGNLRAMGGAIPEQGIELVKAMKEKRAPMISQKMAWLMGLTTIAAAIGTTTQYAYTGTLPENLKDIVAPRINKDDPSERVVVPTYFKDMMHLKHGPLQYLTSSFAGMWGKIADLWNNKDFYNYQIYDPNDPVFGRKGKDMLMYALPSPFSVASFQKMKEKGEPASKQALSFLGFLKAPGYLTHSQVENDIFDRFHIYNMDVKPKDKKEGDDIKKEILHSYRKGDIQEAEKMAKDAVDRKILRETQVDYLFRNLGKEQDPSMYMLSQLPAHEQHYLWNEMTEDEKKKYAWVVNHYPEDRASYLIERVKQDGGIGPVMKEMIANNVRIRTFNKELKEKAGDQLYQQILSSLKQYVKTDDYKQAVKTANQQKKAAKQVIKSYKK